MPRTLSQRVLLLGATALVAPAVLLTSALVPETALAECTVTVGGGTPANPGDDATVTCVSADDPETDRVGNGSGNAQVVLEDDAQIDTTALTLDGISLDDVTVTLGSRARIVAGLDGVDADGDATVTLGPGAVIDAVADGVSALGEAIVTLGENARIMAGQDGVYADGDATVTLGNDAVIDADGVGVLAGAGGYGGNLAVSDDVGPYDNGYVGYGGDATVELGANARIEAGDDGVVANTGDATVTLRPGAVINAVVDGVSAPQGAANVTLGPNAAIFAGQDGVDADGDATVVLGDGARIQAGDDGVESDNGSAIVSLGVGSAITAGQEGVSAGGGDATVTLGTGAGIAAGDDGVYAYGNATVTLGTDASIDAEGVGVLAGTGGYGVGLAVPDGVGPDDNDYVSYGGDATVALGAGARIEAGEEGIVAEEGAVTVTLGDGAAIVAGGTGVLGRDRTYEPGDAAPNAAPIAIDGSDRDVTVQLGANAGIQAGLDGVVAEIRDTTVTLGSGAAITAARDGVVAQYGLATVSLGSDARVVAGDDGVYASSDVTADLGNNAAIEAGDDGVVSYDGSVTVTLGTGAAIDAAGIGVLAGGQRYVPDVMGPADGDGRYDNDGDRNGGFATVTLGDGARIDAGERGVMAADTAIVTLGSGASIAGGYHGVYGGSGSTGDVIDSAGTIEGGDYSLFLREGDDRVTLRTGASLVGTADGGAGTDSLTLLGSGSEDDSFVNFESLTVDGVDWTLSGSAAFDETTVLGGTLTVGGMFDGGDVDIERGAGLITEADATLHAFSFQADGSVVNDGTITADTLVFGPESSLSGGGDVIGSVTLLGRVAPGSSVGTLTFTGDTTFGSSSVLDVDVSPVDGSDRIVVDDGSLTIEPGAQLSVNLLGNDFENGATFTFLEADDGISGSFVGFDAPLLSFTQQLELDATDPNALSFRVATAPGSRLIAEAPYNPVNGGPASLLPRFAANDFGVGVPTVVSTDAADADGLNGIGFGYQRYDIDDTTVENWTVPLNRTFPLDAPGWAVLLNVPLVFADVEGETAFSGSVGVGLTIPVTEDWTVTPTVRLGGVYSDDFRTMAGGYGGSLTSRFRFSLGDFAFDLGNLVGYYAADDVGRLIDDQVAYDTENITFRNGLVMSTPVELFDRSFETQLFAIDTRHTGDDLFVDSYTEFGASVRPRRSLFGLPPLRIGVTGTIGDDVSGIRLNAGYRF